MSGVDAHTKTSGETLVSENNAGVAKQYTPESADVFKQLKLRRRHRYIVYKLENGIIGVEAVGEPGKTCADLLNALPYADCRYVIFDKEYKTSDGRKSNKLFFLSWLPHNATPHLKMAYAHGKSVVRTFCDGVFDVSGATPTEVEVAFGLREQHSEEDQDMEDDDF